MPWLAAVGATVGGITSGIIQSGAQDRATQAQTKASQDALALNREQWDTTQANLEPYRQFGVGALSELGRVSQESKNINPASDAGYNKLTGLSDPGEFNFSTEGPNADPSYQWRLNQGLAGVESSAAARGGYFSGNTGKALMDYGQGSASQEYQNQFGRYNQILGNYMNQEGFNSNEYQNAFSRQMGINQNQFNQFSNIANMGMNATGSANQSGSNYASNASNIAINQGNNIASNANNNANIWGNVISNASNQFTSYLGNQMMANALKSGNQNYGPYNTYGNQ
jgi:hypothetical protein